MFHSAGHLQSSARRKVKFPLIVGPDKASVANDWCIIRAES